jgi:hypothetical protein
MHAGGAVVVIGLLACMMGFWKASNRTRQKKN